MSERSLRLFCRAEGMPCYSPVSGPCPCGDNRREVEARRRRVDEPVIQADIGRLKALGWTPEYPWERTLEDILNHWRTHPAPH